MKCIAENERHVELISKLFSYISILVSIKTDSAASATTQHCVITAPAAGPQSQQLPDLIDKLRVLVDGQYADTDTALCGCRDYRLH